MNPTMTVGPAPSADLQDLRTRDRGDVAVLGSDPARDRGRLRALVGAQLQTAALPDRLRCVSFPPLRRWS